MCRHSVVTWTNHNLPFLRRWWQMTRQRVSLRIQLSDVSLEHIVIDKSINLGIAPRSIHQSITSIVTCHTNTPPCCDRSTRNNSVSSSGLHRAVDRTIHELACSHWHSKSVSKQLKALQCIRRVQRWRWTRVDGFLGSILARRLAGRLPASNQTAAKMRFRWAMNKEVRP